jgi:arylsulfatase A-like enzyme/predicted Zn-dependent protease
VLRLHGPVLATLFSALFLFGSCREKQQAAPAASADTPIFLISIDTLRSDRLPVYGYSAIATPAITALRQDAVLFERAFSHVPLTLPAHISMFTGKLPSNHGVRDNIGYVLGPGQRTLAEVLKEQGYSTGGAVSSYVLRNATGVARGFDFFDDELEFEKATLRTAAERNGDSTREALERWLRASTSRRVFGFLHLYEPHARYTPPPEHASADPYDGEIRYADAIVGRFIATLKERGLYDDAMIVLLSDHGEALGEHGELDHGVFLYREALQVPLLVKLPRGERAGETERRLSGLVDVMPTVLKRLGIDAGISDGTDLFAKVPAARHIYAETYFPRLHFGWHELHAVLDESYHYVDGPSPELYAYRADPGELRNVLNENRRAAFTLRGALEKQRKPFTEPAAVDPEDQRRLASLGYLGSGGAASAVRPDPKAKIGALRSLKQGAALLETGNARAAAQELTEFVEENPEMVDGWWLLGQALRSSGRSEEALQAWKKALRRFPANSTLAFSTADVLFELGRLDEARAHAQLALASDPVHAHELIAQMEMKLRRWPAAEKELRLALAAEPRRTATLLLLAAVLQRQEKRAEELELLNRTVTLISERRLPAVRGLQFRRGEALLATGRGREAEAAFRAETETFPRNEQAWASLAVVTAASGRTREAHAVLDAAVRQNPTRSMYALAIECAEVMGDRGYAASLRNAARAVPAGAT